MRRRVSLGLLLACEVLLAVLISHEASDLEQRYRRSAEALLTDTARWIAAVLAPDLQTGTVSAERLQQLLAPGQHAGAPLPDLRIRLTDQTGRALFDSLSRGRRAAPDPADAPTALLVVATPIVWHQAVIGEVRVGTPLAGLALAQDSARRHFFLGGLYIGLALIAIAVAFTLWWLRPLDLILEYLAAVRRHQFRALPNLSRSTLGWCGAVLDAMRDALAGRDYVEEYVQALTHELRTPLATIRAHAELLEGPLPARQQRRCLTHIDAATGRIQSVVDRLLELTALEKRRRLSDRQRVSLAQVLAEAADTLTVELRTKHLTLTRVVSATASVRGQQALLVCAVVNLLQNAIAFSPESGAIEVALTDAGDAVELTLHDHGPGIPDYAHERLFEHFYSLPRPDGQPRSTGLGLTLVREIAELHHGQVEVTNHPDGGAIARLRLPKV
ncbi:ATP-binding protein [Methylotetracoccus oryzae]|uniref:ATP-binding protein n=1 Tax=Methylotetracoccus oryzae TaxID=1919059 RepID=UPI001119AF99|nr:ATP-binding protein [Methylotetracoccus oryzae]